MNPVCPKRSYPSEKAARLAHKHAGFRIRPYICDHCGKIHVANQDKDGRSTEREVEWRPSRSR